MTAVASATSKLSDLRRVSPRATPALPALRSLQLGQFWFAESPGGLDRYYSELIRHLPDAGVSCRGFVIGSDRVDGQSGGTVSSAAKPQDSLFKRWMSMRRSVASARNSSHFDVVASHLAWYTAPVLSQIRCTPLVVHFHGPFAAESSTEDPRWFNNSVKHLVERTVYSRADRCITLSKAFATILHQSYGVAEDRIRVVPGAVETARFDAAEDRAQARERLRWPKDRPITFSVRRLYRRMGLENLIESVKVIRQRVPDILVMIAGTGWMAPQLKQQIESAGLANHVRLLGFMTDADLPLAYRAADLTVVPTVSLEGFGLSTVESMAAGTPPIVTPVGGSPEVVGPLSPDLIVPDWTPTALAAAITAAFRGDLKLPTSAQCQAYARENFDWSTIAQRVRAVYDQAILAAQPEAA
jgi:glycosyltransferase involved in cell wall biosynthesis